MSIISRALDQPRRTHFDEVLLVGAHSEARQAVALAPGAIAVVERMGPRAVLFQCPCGCGETLITNVDAEAGKAWRMRLDHFGLTLMPSVWRTSGCRSHFILWRNQVWWCDWYDGADDEPSWPDAMDAELRAEWRRIRNAEKAEESRA